MFVKIPVIIQGGMGAGVSSWRLAKAVSRLGSLGVVAGTALDEILVRRLQEGDPEGHVRRALEHFPLPRMAQSIIDKYFISDGKAPDRPYITRQMPAIEGTREGQELCIAGNFVEVFLAREGHDNPVGINYLEKIQFPHLPSLYGAILAGVAVVIMGAGIPLEIPDAIDALVLNRECGYTANVTGAVRGSSPRMQFDPIQFLEGEKPPADLQKPAFLPIISSMTLANVLLRKTGGRLAGFVVEGPLAGGHNAPPRGAPVMTSDGQPVYGPRDAIDLPGIAKLGKPFWLAGSYGSAAGLREALAIGAAGIQVGTAFALCRESSLVPAVRQELVRKALTGQAKVFTDPIASPTGFPFKVAELDGTLSQLDVYEKRQRICNLGFLREPYVRPDGQVGYRCAAEPSAAYLAKGGKAENVVNRKCLCNSLMANIGMPQIMADESLEKCLVTLGDDLININRFCSLDNPDYSAADVIKILTSAIA